MTAYLANSRFDRQSNLLTVYLTINIYNYKYMLQPVYVTDNL